MSFFDDLIAAQSLDDVRASLIGYAQAAGLNITNWLAGSTGQQLLESVVSQVSSTTTLLNRVARGFASLATSTDPGDPDTSYPANQSLAPESGFLSNLGANTFSTTREAATFATGLVTFVNGSGVPVAFAPGDLTLVRSTGSPPPTYRNVAASSYDKVGGGTLTPGVGGVLTVPSGVSVYVPIEAEEVGTASNATAGTLSLLNVIASCSATNGALVSATDREAADVYRDRCRKAAARLSFGGPSDAFAYLAAKDLAGNPLYGLTSGGVSTGTLTSVTRAFVSTDSSIGVVTAYYASAAGAVIDADVRAANVNIAQNAYAIPDAMTFGLLVTDPGPGGASATPTTINVSGSYRRRSLPGVSDADAEAAMTAAVVAMFPSLPIGGLDVVAGMGNIYGQDVQAAAATATTGSGGSLGVYDVTVTLSAYTLAVGEVAMPGTIGWVKL